MGITEAEYVLIIFDIFSVKKYYKSGFIISENDIASVKGICKA